MAHFPTVKVKKPTDIVEYTEEIHILQQEFSSQFQDFEKHQTAFNLLSESFDINVKTVPDHFNLEIQIYSATRT
jgi:hypothetical protein